jgi:hypothetical protein
MTFDVVYIYRNYNTSEFDLRYSLRSLKNLKNMGNLFIIGDNHVWFNRLKWFNVTNDMKTKQINAMKKILFACKRPEISENFLLMNDDFLFLEETDINETPIYYLGKLDFKFINKKRGLYKQALINCLEFLPKKPLNFEAHYPILINKKEFLRILENKPWDRRNTVYRSIYQNNLKNAPEQLKQRIKSLLKDFKAYNLNDFNKLKYGKFLSSDNKLSGNQEYKDWLREKFPDKCIYETRVTGKY